MVWTRKGPVFYPLHNGVLTIGETGYIVLTDDPFELEDNSDTLIKRFMRDYDKICDEYRKSMVNGDTVLTDVVNIPKMPTIQTQYMLSDKIVSQLIEGRDDI